MVDESSGYEAFAHEFMSHRSPSVGIKTVTMWARSLPRGTDVLDLGCGHGKPLSVLLAGEGMRLFGVDGSRTLLAHYQQNIPHAVVDCSSVEESKFFQRSFGAVLAWGLIFLLSPDIQESVFRKVGAALRPGGSFLFTAPHKPCEWTDNLTGRVSRSLGTECYERLLMAQNLHIEDELDDEGGNHSYFVRKHAAE